MSKGIKISIREFARQISVSEGAVRKAIERGDLKKGYDSVSKKIDPAVASKNAWVQQQGVIKPKAGVSRVKAIEKLNRVEKTKKATDQEGDDEVDDSGDVDISGNNLDNLLASIKITSNLKASEAARRREIIALALDKKKLEEAEGVLVRREKVEQALFVLGSELKKALLDIPARCARDVMAASTEVEAMKVLTDEIIHILNIYGNLKNDSLN